MFWEILRLSSFEIISSWCLDVKEMKRTEVSNCLLIFFYLSPFCQSVSIKDIWNLMKSRPNEKLRIKNSDKSFLEFHAGDHHKNALGTFEKENGFCKWYHQNQTIDVLELRIALNPMCCFIFFYYSIHWHKTNLDSGINKFWIFSCFNFGIFSKA